MQKYDFEKEAGVTIIDKLDGPNSIAFDITGNCNYRCMHCYNRSGESLYQELTDKELLEVTNQIIELRPISVCICGGEPLLRGPIVFDIISKLSQYCGIVNMVSNGYFVTEEVIQRLISSGLHTLQISLDGDCEFLHNNLRQNNEAFDRAVNAIKLGKEQGLKMVVSFCPHKLNAESIEETCDLCYRLGVSEFRVMPLIPMGRGKNIENLVLNPEEYLVLQQRLLKKKKYYQEKNYVIDWGDPIDHLHRMPENAKKNIKSYIMEVRSDGKISATSYIPVIFGDCKKHTLKEYWEAGFADVWKNKEFLKYIKDIVSVWDFQRIIPEPYSGEDILIKLLD